MNPSIRTHAHGGGKALVHTAAILAMGMAVLLGAAAVIVVLYLGLALLATGEPLGQVAGSVVLALGGIAVALFFRWALR